MATKTTTLLDLPTELLDKIYSYLDWDRTASVEPERENIYSVSLVCRHLRQTILPILFKDATLKLRWVDGALIEPSLLNLRRECPHLARHIRCIYIKTLFGQYADPDMTLKSLAVPEQLDDWCDPAEWHVNDDERSKLATHRQRVNDVACKLIEGFQKTIAPHECPPELRERAEDLIRQLSDLSESFNDKQTQPPGASRGVPGSQEFVGRQPLDSAVSQSTHNDTGASPTHSSTSLSNRDYRSLRVQLDALVTVMLCFPPSLNSMYFESLPQDATDSLQNTFALHVAATAMQVFGDRLQHLALITCSHLRDSHVSRILGHTQNQEPTRKEQILVPEVLSHLSALSTMTFASYARRNHNGNDWRDLVPHDVERWHALPTTIARLELTNVNGTSETFVRLVKGFTHLQDLSFCNVTLGIAPNARHGPYTDDSLYMLWIVLLVELRRLQPGTTFHLRNLSPFARLSALPSSAVNWLLKEAVPVGCTVDVERETRLVEDFKSFLPLWRADDSGRGDLAKIARVDGKLVDAAMSSRWQMSADSW